MSAAKRRYPRVSFEHTGIVELRAATGPKTSALVKLPVAIKTISCEGTGVAVVDPAVRLDRGASVRVHLAVNEHRFEIPGRIAWVVKQPSGTGPAEFGVRFQLELAENAMRQAYARWIVDLITVATRSHAQPAR